MKKMTALWLAVMMLLSMMAVASAEEPRHILIGTTWDKYWDSTHESIDVFPGYSGTTADEMQFAKVKEIEEEWGVTFEYVNLLYSGAKESINPSIRAGAPDVDVYMVGIDIAAPAIANGYAIDLRDVLPADHPVLTGEDPVLGYVDVGDGSASLLVEKNVNNLVANTYPLSFNLQMIEEANLEDPRDLVERGEWTWDKFVEYCVALTKDTDGDGITDVYGFGGWPTDYLTNLLMSNGTYIASNATENMSSAEVAEVLQFMQDLNLSYGVMHPIPAENGWDICRWLYREGKVAFCPNAAWILDSNSDYGYQNPDIAPLEFDMVFVQWPVGPSGNAETNMLKTTMDTGFMIPVGVENPELVFNVLYDLLNWFNYDPADPDSAEEALALRDDEEALGWWYGVTAKDVDLQTWNFDVMLEMGQKQQYEMVNNLGFDIDYLGLINGNYTVAQFQETYKLQVQDALDRLMGN